MNGRQVFRNAVARMPETVQAALSAHDLVVADDGREGHFQALARVEAERLSEAGSLAQHVVPSVKGGSGVRHFDFQSVRWSEGFRLASITTLLQP